MSVEHCRDGAPCQQAALWGRGCPEDVDGGGYNCERGLPSPFEHGPDGVPWVHADEDVYIAANWP